MTLIKTSLLNGIAVVIKMLTLLGLNKILAIYVGPAGYAALGQFQNAVQMITTLASGAINTGVTKYTAEYHEDEAKQHAVWR
ncbi:MAG: O-antigen translocase, partial [Marinobacterium sp.]